MTSTPTPRHRPRRAAVALPAALALALATVGGALPAAAAVPEPQLHWTMDDIADGTVPDASGHGLTGTVSGSASPVDTGDGGTALDLAGGPAGGYVTVPRGALDGATDLTVSTRVRWDGTGGPWQWLYALGTDASRYLFTTPSNDAGRLRTSVTTAGGGAAESQVTGSAALPAGRWVTVTTTLDTTADRVTTYLDGVAVSSTATTISAGELLTAGATTAGFLGRSFYPDPLLDAAVDDFRIWHEALPAEQVAELVGDELPALEELTQDAFDVRTPASIAPELPSSVPGAYSDGYDRDVPVTWDAIDPAQYARTGTFTVAGQAGGRAVSAAVTVHRGELRVDLATDRGEFLGGASGLLYGLYGDGMPTDNLVEGMGVRTVATKAQDGAQHPGSDALEVVGPLADTTDGDVYLRVTDWYRGFPYQWPGDTPEEKLADYARVLDGQLDRIATLDPEHRDNLVIEPFNEPEGNMFGTGEWSLDRTSWLTDPTAYFAAWDTTYRTIKERYPDMRVAGPGTSQLFGQVEGFLEHTVEAGTVPDIITWHELTHPQAIRDSVERFRGWEAQVFAGTDHEGTELPININEYAFNYHTSVPGQMVQWMSAIEDTKVDAMIAFWNINGNLSDSAVQTNRGNGQWWLYNAYAQMTGHTVQVTPPAPGENYTLQGVATLDEEAGVARALLGGGTGSAPVDVVNVPADVFGDQVRVTVREIPWTGQLGDSAQPRHLAELTLPVHDGAVTVDFGGDVLPALVESSAYELVVTPAGAGATTVVTPELWQAGYEAEDAAHTGTGYSRNGPEGSPQDVGKFYTSGGYDVGGLRTGSDVTLDFTVDVPQDGTYDLAVFSSSLNTYPLVQEQGPTNVFVRVDGAAEQEIHLPLGYKWVVWDHADTTVDLTAGTHTITLAARSLDGRGTQGDAIVDRITLSLPQPGAESSVYEGELASLDGARPDWSTGESGAGVADLAAGGTATFWVYGERDAEAALGVDLTGDGTGTLAVNGHDVLDLDGSGTVAAHLQGGVNKVTVTAGAGGLRLDRLTVGPGSGALAATAYQAEEAALAGAAHVVDLSLAEGGRAVDGIGGAPGNDSALTFTVDAEQAGPHAVVVRFANPEQVDGTHYNPNPVARHADITVNDGAAQRVLFVPTFHRNNFWERTIVLDLADGANTITFRSQEATNWDGETYASQTWPADYNLRADEAPVVDRITVSALAAVTETAETWDAGTVYDTGDTVVHAGATWLASWWTRGQAPGDPYGPWQEIAAASDGTPLWTPSRIFHGGDVAVHDGQRYEARWWTRNQVPGTPHGPWVVTGSA
jgi:chitodextrinase